MPHTQATLAAIALGLFISAPASAQADAERIDFSIPAQPLGAALREVALRAGRSIIAPSEIVADKAAPALTGRHTVEEAVAILLGHSGLKVTIVGASFVIGRRQGPDYQAQASVSDVVVTGTRIRGSAPAGSRVVTVDRAAIDRSGYATTQQLAQSLPQNFGGGPNEANTSIASGRDNAGLNVAFGSGVNLRGLGSNSTLVLLDGARPPLGGFGGVFSDLSLIPLSAVERIEVLPDGASAIYGADAVAGVVNVISRREVGWETRVRLGTADGDLNEFQVGLIGGFRWSGGRATVAYEFYQRERLEGRDRAYATEDLTRFGGSDFRSEFAAPGTVFAGGMPYAINAGRNSAASLPNPFVAGRINRRDRWLTADILPAQRRHSVFVSAEQALGPQTELFVRALAADRRFDKRELSTLSETPATVTVINPFYVNPTGGSGPVSVQYDFSADLGPETARGSVRAVGGTGGLRQSIGAWRGEVAVNYGRQRENTITGNVANTARLARALADPNPATAYNVFGDPGSTNPATIATVRGSSSSAGAYSIWSASAKIDGPVINLAPGAIRLALGGEHRAERFKAYPSFVDTRQLTPQPFNVGDLPGTRRIDAGYAELLIPLASADAPLPLAHRLDVSIAGRVERYSDVGTTTNPKIGVRYDPVAGWSIRGTYGTSFRAPGFNDLRQGPTYRLFFPIFLPDPTALGGQRGVLVLRGNDPDLGPEKARTWTLGTDLHPAFLPGLSASATYFNIRYRDRIATPAADLFSFLSDPARFAPILDGSPSAAFVAAIFADPSFLNPFGLTPADIAVVADARTQNLSVTTETGLDVETSYRARLGTADIGLVASGTYLFSLKQALTPTAPRTSVLDTFGYPSRFRLRVSADVTRGPVSGAASLNHVSGYRNTLTDPREPVGAWTTLDVQIGYKFEGSGNGATMLLSATNLLDRSPPYLQNFDGLTAVGFDPQAASPLGRVIALEVRRSW